MIITNTIILLRNTWIDYINLLEQGASPCLSVCDVGSNPIDWSGKRSKTIATKKKWLYASSMYNKMVNLNKSF